MQNALIFIIIMKIELCAADLYAFHAFHRRMSGWLKGHIYLIFLSQGTLDALGEVLLQDNFTVWDPKQLIKKGRDRHLFLFDMCLLVSKEVKDSTGKSKYLYKFRLMVRVAM